MTNPGSVGQRPWSARLTVRRRIVAVACSSIVVVVLGFLMLPDSKAVREAYFTTIGLSLAAGAIGYFLDTKA